MIFTKHRPYYVFLLFTTLALLPIHATQNDPFSNIALPKDKSLAMDIFGTTEKFEKNIAIDFFPETKQIGVFDNVEISESEPLRSMDIFDDIDSFEDSIAIDSFLDTVSLENMPSRAIEVASILGILESMGAFNILDQDFYLRTNPFAKRSLLDLPLWELHSCTEPERWIVGAHAFWNHMDRSVFTDKSTNIESYINFDKTILFETLNNLPPEVKAALPNTSLIDDLLDETNVDSLLALFKNFTVQQRRTGAMFHAWRQWKYVELRMLLPFYYIERNNFARPEEQALLEERFGALDQDTQEQFQKNYLISDKIGFGDFRFEADYALYKSDDFTFRVGVFTTLPIAFALKEGIQGSSFIDNNKTQPTFDLQALFDLIPDDFDISSITEQDQQTAYEIVVGDMCKRKNGFLLGVLDRLSAMLLDTKLGNDQHVGLGFMLRARTLLSTFLYQFEWAKRISFNNRLSLEYLTPANETRFFVYRNKASDFSSRDFSSEDTAVQAANLQFVQEELVNKFYPFAVKTKVQPGVIFRWLSRYCFCGEVWDLTIGSDFWLQTDETFESFCTSQPLDRLDIEHGKVPFAYQSKIFGSMALKWERPTLSWHFGVNAEGTIWHKGIGKDWTVSLNIEANF